MSWVPAAILVLLLGLPTAALGRPEADPRLPQIRQVVVTDLHCGLEGARRADHRMCALKCFSEGRTLALYDPERDALYRVVKPQRELEVRVMIDFGGLEGVARGVWNDDALTVQLLDIQEPRRTLHTETEILVEPVLIPGSEDRRP